MTNVPAHVWKAAVLCWKTVKIYATVDCHSGDVLQ